MYVFSFFVYIYALICFSFAFTIIFTLLASINPKIKYTSSSMRILELGRKLPRDLCFLFDDFALVEFLFQGVRDLVAWF